MHEIDCVFSTKANDGYYMHPRQHIHVSLPKLYWGLLLQSQNQHYTVMLFMIAYWLYAGQVKCFGL